MKTEPLTDKEWLTLFQLLEQAADIAHDCVRGSNSVNMEQKIEMGKREKTLMDARKVVRDGIYWLKDGQCPKFEEEDDEGNLIIQ